MTMRIRFVLAVRLKEGREEEFLSRYGAIRDRVSRGVTGNLEHQACQSLDDPRSWIITSVWSDQETYQQWERSDEHRALTLPLRDCWDEARMTKYAIRTEAGRRGGE